MKKIALLLLAVLLLTYLAPCALAAPKVVLSSQRLSVDDEIVECEKYNIDGNNYFKLRDLAYLLSGTESEFSVDWDAKRKTVTLKTGESYTPVGGELDTSGGDKSDTAKKVSGQKLIVDGMEAVGLTIYNIGGNNYFKLRDLYWLLQFTMEYNEAANMVAIYGVAPPKKCG